MTSSSVPSSPISSSTASCSPSPSRANLALASRTPTMPRANLARLGTLWAENTSRPVPSASICERRAASSSYANRLIWWGSRMEAGSGPMSSPWSWVSLEGGSGDRAARRWMCICCCCCCCCCCICCCFWLCLFRLLAPSRVARWVLTTVPVLASTGEATATRSRAAKVSLMVGITEI